MRRGILIICLCAVSAFALAYAAFAQSKEHIDKLKEAERHIELLKKVEDAIKTIEKDRKVLTELHIFDVADLMLARIVKDYAPPSPFVFDVSSAGAEEFERAEEPFEEPLDPEELIERVKLSIKDEGPATRDDKLTTISYSSGKLFVISTPKKIKKIEALLAQMRKNLPVLISSTVYLVAADEDYLKGLKDKDSSAIGPKAIEKMLADARTGEKVELLKTGYLTSYSGQAAYLCDGSLHTYVGKIDTMAYPATDRSQFLLEPIVNVFREGFIAGLRAQYDPMTGQVNLVAMVSLSKLTAIEEHTGIAGGTGATPTKCKIETPKVDLQIVSGSADIPKGCGLLLGGSRMKTAQDRQKSFVVLIVPAVQK